MKINLVLRLEILVSNVLSHTEEGDRPAALLLARE